MNTLIIDNDFKLDLNNRKKESHKYDYGKVLIVAGSKSMVGAAILTAHAAYRTGAGLVKILIEEGSSIPLFTSVPEAIVSTYNRNIDLFEKEQDNILEAVEWSDTILIGPGMGTDLYSRKLFEYILENSKAPMVIDADGLNILSSNLDLLKAFKSSVIITPHIGEMSRLINIKSEAILKKRKDYAIKFSNDYNVITVLKSDLTVVACKEKIYINKIGNPGMATAGSGDVLSGIITSLLGQGYSPEKAAALGVYIHSRAGDYARDTYGEHSVMARDIIEYISTVIIKSLK